MTVEGPLREGLLSLREAASRFLPVTGVGVLRSDGPGHLVMTYADAYGCTVYRVPARLASRTLREPSPGLSSVAAAELEAGPMTALEGRLLPLAPLSSKLREQLLMRQLVILPLYDGDPSAKLLLGLGTADALTAKQEAQARTLGERAGEDLFRPESAAEELER